MYIIKQLYIISDKKYGDNIQIEKNNSKQKKDSDNMIIKRKKANNNKALALIGRLCVGVMLAVGSLTAPRGGKHD